MNISKLIVYIILCFMVVGIADRIFFKDRFGYGTKFEEGIMAMGPLAISMLGIMCFAPVLGSVLEPVVAPLYKAIGADPGMLAGTLFAMDMGGYPLALAMTDDEWIRQLSGIYISTMMGATLTFSIPVSLGIMKKEHKNSLAKGILAGIIAIPFGGMISGAAAGMPFGFAAVNLIPSLILAVLLAIGLAVIPEKILKGFSAFAGFINILILICLGIAIIQALAGVDLIKGMDPIGPQLEIVGTIALTLAGAYPMMHFITQALKKPLKAIGNILGINEIAVAGMIACLANNIPMYTMTKDMDERGRVMAIAFSVCASFALGDHLGFASAINAEYVAPMIAGKLAGGVLAVVIAAFITGKKNSDRK